MEIYFLFPLEYALGIFPLKHYVNWKIENSEHFQGILLDFSTRAQIPFKVLFILITNYSHSHK